MTDRSSRISAGIAAGRRLLVERMLAIEHRDILRGFVASFGSKLATAAMQFAQNVVFSRLLGATGVGIYFLAVSIYRVGEAVGQVGFSYAVVREVAAQHALSAWRAVRRLWLAAALISLLLGSATAIAIWIAAPSIARLMDHPDSIAAIRLVAWAVVPGVFNVLIGAALRGMNRQIASNVLGPLLVSLAAMITFYLATSGAGSRGAIQAFLIGQLVSAVALAAAAWRYSSRQDGIDDRGNVRALMHSAVPLWLISIASLGNDSIGVLVLGALGTAEEIGLFGVAARLVLLLSFLSFSVQAVCEPQLSARFRSGDPAALLSSYRFGLLLATGLAALCGGMLAILVGPLLALFGPEFAAAALPFLIMTAGVTIVTALSPSGSLLIMIGQARAVAVIALVALPMLVVSLVLAVPGYGATGAALATASVYMFRAIAQAIVAERALHRLIPRTETP